MPIVTLLTDFGLRDPFVGEMKGVLLSRAADLAIVDVTHGIRPGNIREGAWVLSKSWDRFPAGTCHVAVVDPGVGSARRAIAARAGRHLFVGPDNGVLGEALRTAGLEEVREISVRDIDRVRRGTTFDGRDLFAPVAAEIAVSGTIAGLGPQIDDPLSAKGFRPKPDDDGWTAEIVRQDRFGNLVTAAEEGFLRAECGEGWRGLRVEADGTTIEGVREAYADVGAGELLLTIGGSGTLEICVNGASAAERLRCGPGSRVRIGRPGA